MFILKPTVLFGGKEKRSQALGVQVCVCVKDVIIRQYLFPPSHAALQELSEHERTNANRYIIYYSSYKHKFVKP